MKILQIASSIDPEMGGVSEGLRQQCTSLAALGEDVEVLTLDAPDADWLKNFPVKTHGVGPAKGGYSHSPNLIPWLKNNVARYDAVVLNGLWQYHTYASRKVLKGLKKPYVVYSHGMLDPWFNRTNRLKQIKKNLYWIWGEYPVLRDAYAVLFTCEEERIQARDSFRPYQVNEEVAGYGTAGPEKSLDALEEAFYQEFPDLKGRRFILFLSRIHEKKGCDLLVEAFAKVAKSDPDLLLVIAGPASEELAAQLKAMAEKLGISDRIVWPGMIRGDAKWGAYCACEAFILPSHQENFGIVVAESLACATPVLISNKVNIWREIESERAGIVASDTIDGTVELFTKWLALDDNGRAAMSKNGPECFARNFEIKSAAERLRNVLTKMLAA